MKSIKRATARPIMRQLFTVAIMAVSLPLALAVTATAATASVSRTPSSHARAEAQALSGYGLDNTDPRATGCWDSRAYPTGKANIYDKYGDYLGYVDNWYSPDCGTNWSETFTSGGSATITVWTCRSSYCTDKFTAYTTSAWSNQVYAPTTTACAEGTIYVRSGITGTNESCV